jgi:Zn-dependent oligopeptidase
MAVLPVACHLPALYWAYSVCFVVSSLLWDVFMQQDPFHPTRGGKLRSLLFEAGADIAADELMVRLLGNDVALADMPDLHNRMQHWLWSG